MTRVQRFDYLGFSPNVQVTPQGFIRVPARVARTGILEYRLADGSVRKELREDSEVFASESLASLEGAPVLDDHAVPLVNPDNVTSVSKGFVGGSVRQDGKFVAATLTIQSKDMIDKINKGERKELSAGYTCDYEPCPGEYKGQRYDGKQTNIVYNHVALLPEGFGRSGPEVSLRLDGAGYSVTNDIGDNADKTISEGIKMAKATIKLDGVTYEIELADGLEKTFLSSIEKLESTRNDSVDKMSKLEGELSVSHKEISELKARLDSFSDPKEIDERVKARVDLIEKARKLKGDIVTEGKTDIQIKLDSISDLGYGDLSDKNDAFVDGVFEAELKRAQKPVTKPAGPTPAPNTTEVKLDSNSARQRMIDRNREAWKQPLGKQA